MSVTARKVLSSKIVALERFRDFLLALLWDARNLLKYGRQRPVKFQLIWCDPAAIKRSTRYFIPVEGKYLRSGDELNVSGLRSKYRSLIAAGEWDEHTVEIDDVAIVHRTKKKYRERLSWEAVSEIEWMMRNIKRFGTQDGCSTLDEVIERCARLDGLFSFLKNGGTFSTQRRLSRAAFREYGGIGVGIDRFGGLIWMKGGAHRLAIAQQLGLTQIPACLQIVHEDAVEAGLVYASCSKVPLLAAGPG